MISSKNDRKVFKAFSDDGATYADVTTSRKQEIRKLFKALSDDPALHAAIRACGSPAEKHVLIRNAGYTPVSQQELKSELAKCLTPSAYGVQATADDEDFVDTVLHLASGDASDFGVA